MQTIKLADVLKIPYVPKLWRATVQATSVRRRRLKKMRGMIKVASDGRRVKPANDFVVSALRFYCGILSCDDDVVDKRCVENN